jgi:hypothetical protein
MTDVEQRVAAVEARLESAFALDARLKTIEGDLRKVKGGSSLRDWLQTLGPYIGGLVVLLVGYWIKDSVTLALEREKLNLAYAQQMPALLKTLDESDSQQVADRNAVALAMYGKYAISPLLDRLELGGDVLPLAAQRGLRIVGFQDSVEACPTFRRVINDRTHRFKWQTHKTLIRVIGQSECADARADLESYRAALAQLGSDDTRLQAFAQRYSTADGFDAETVSSLTSEIDRALAIIGQVKT